MEKILLLILTFHYSYLRGRYITKMDLKHVELNHVGSVRGRTNRNEKQFVIFVLLLKASNEKRSLVQSLRL